MLGAGVLLLRRPIVCLVDGSASSLNACGGDVLCRRVHVCRCSVTVLCRRSIFVVASSTNVRRCSVQCLVSSVVRSSVVGRRSMYLCWCSRDNDDDDDDERTNERPHERRTTNDEQRRRPTTAIFLASFLPRRSLIACIPSSGYVLCVCFKGFVISLTRTLWYYHGYRPGVLRSQIRPRLRLKRLFQKCLNSYYGVTKTLGICRH